MNLREFTHSPAVTCTQDTTIAEAARTMEQHNVGSIIVVDERGGLVGIATDRDIAIRGMAAELTPSTPVAEIMTRNVVSLREDADLFDAGRTMATAGCRRLPVIGADGALAGVVSLDDLMLLFARQTDGLAAAVASETTGPATRG